jgi:hypothetical protein
LIVPVASFRQFLDEYGQDLMHRELFLAGYAPYPVGTNLQVEFRLDEGFSLLRGTANVVAARLRDEGPDGRAGLRLRLLQLDVASERLLQAILS